MEVIIDNRISSQDTTFHYCYFSHESKSWGTDSKIIKILVLC